MPAPHMQHLAALIENDSHAASFQSLGQYRTALLKEIAKASAQLPTAGVVVVPQMVDFSPVPDDFRNQTDGYRAGWNDCRAVLAAAPHPVSGEQKPASVQITGHLDEVDAPVWEFINAEARKLGPATGSIDTYNFTQPNGAQPNGVVAVLWNGMAIHALSVTVRDSMNRTQCVRLLADAPPAAQDVSGLIDVATGKIQHARNGMCPDLVEGFDVSDPECPACRVIAAHRAQAQGGDV